MVVIVVLLPLLLHPLLHEHPAVRGGAGAGRAAAGRPAAAAGGRVRLALGRLHFADVAAGLFRVTGRIRRAAALQLLVEGRRPRRSLFLHELGDDSLDGFGGLS